MQTPIRQQQPNFKIPYLVPPNAAPAQCRPERMPPLPPYRRYCIPTQDWKAAEIQK